MLKTDENLIICPPSMSIAYLASPPFVRLFFARYCTKAYCTFSEIFSICNEQTGGNHINTSLCTGVENLMYLPITIPAPQEQVFSGRNGKPCHFDSARSGWAECSLRPTSNIKDLGKWNFYIWWKSRQSNRWEWECWTACTKVFIMANSNYS